MKILISGATGFVGKNLVESLSGHSLHFYTRNSQLREVVDFQPDIIYHLAAEIYDDSKMFNSNVVLTYHLLEMAQNLKNLKSFVYVGSSSEYGFKEGPMNEKDFLDPRTLYEATKGCGSLLCLAFARSYGLPATIARPFSVYGPHEPSKRFIPTIYRTWKEKGTLTIAPGVHDFIYIDDFIRGLNLLGLAHKPEFSARIFNFGTGIQTSNEQLVQIFENIVEEKIMKIYVEKNMRLYDSQSWVCDPSIIEKDLGFFYDYSLSAGLREYIEFMEKK